MRRAVEANLLVFGDIHRSLPREAQHRLQVKAYKTLPSVALYQADEVFVFGIYFHGVLAISAPQTRVSGAATLLGRSLAHEFATIWQLETTSVVDPVDPRHWIECNG